MDLRLLLSGPESLLCQNVRHSSDARFRLAISTRDSLPSGAAEKSSRTPHAPQRALRAEPRYQSCVVDCLVRGGIRYFAVLRMTGRLGHRWQRRRNPQVLSHQSPNGCGGECRVHPSTFLPSNELSAPAPTESETVTLLLPSSSLLPSSRRVSVMTLASSPDLPSSLRENATSTLDRLIDDRILCAPFDPSCPATSGNQCVVAMLTSQSTAPVCLCQ